MAFIDGTRSPRLDVSGPSTPSTNGKGKVEGHEVQADSTRAIARPRSSRVPSESGPILTRAIALPDPAVASGRGGIGKSEAAQVRADMREFRALGSRLENIKGGALESKFQNIGETHSQVLDALSESSAGGADTDLLLDDAQSEIERLESSLDEVESSSSQGHDAVRTFHGAFKASVDDLKAGLAQKRAETAGWTPGSSAITEKNVYAVKLASAQGAKRMLEAEIAKLGSPGDAAGQATLKRALATVEKHIGHLETFDGTEALAKDRLKSLVGEKDDELAKSIFADVDFTVDGHSTPDWKGGVREETMLKALLKTAFKQAGVADGRDPKAEMLDHRKAVLNERSWKTIVQDVPIQIGEKKLTMQSTIKPQSQVQASFDDLKGGGLNCHMTKVYSHCPNVAISRAEVGGTVLFQGIRHGVMSAFGLTPKNIEKMSLEDKQKIVDDLLLHRPNGQTKTSSFGNDAATIARKMEDSSKFSGRVAKELRTAAADHRAFDVAKTALVANPEKLDSALKGGKVTITLNSLSLLTPSVAMGTKPKGGVGIERQMRTDQEEALARLAAQRQPVTMTIKDDQGEDRTVVVTIKARSFNFGVNKLATQFLPGKNPISGLLNGWSNCEAQNKKAMSDLQTAVDDWLALGEQDPDVSDKVKTLSDQVKQIFDSGSYRRTGERNPYELTSRIALLSHLIGEDSCWNCKSGKDRTGFLDSQVKDLAMRIHLNDGEIPAVGEERSEAEIKNFQAIVLGGGNHELQTLNTGAPGYKLDVNSLANQLGGKDPFFQTKALSGTVES